MVRVSKVGTNGLAVPADQPAPGTVSQLAAPRIERWVDVPDYPGYTCRLWINYPRALRAAFDMSGIVEAVEAMTAEEAQAYGEAKVAELEGALSAVVLEHNGWPDEDGYVLPQPPDPAVWKKADQHLVNVVMRLAMTAPGQLPNSLQPMRRR